jgi:ADP-heptose:LPS heptosyltransferase
MTKIPNWLKIDRVIINLAGEWVGLGDIIAVAPLVSAIRSASPKCKIYATLTGTKWNSIVGLMEGNVKTINVGNDFYRFRKLWLNGLFRFRRPWSRTAFFYDYMAPRSRASLLGRIMGAKFRFGYGPNEDGEACPDTHKLSYNSIGISPFHYSVDFDRITGLKTDSTVLLGKNRLEAEGKKLIGDLGIKEDTRIFAMHPGSDSNHMAKRWPAESFAKLASELKLKHQIAGIVILGPDEHAVLGDWPKESPAIFVTGHTIHNIACILSCCEFLISNDSGIMNLAFALGIPGIALFGPTSAAKHDGWFLNGKFLQSSYNSVCPSCYGSDRYRVCDQIPPPCMESITVDEVIEKLQDVL